MLFRNQKIKAFGLDISDSAIKIVELDFAKNQTYPRAFADVSLGEKIINNHIIVNQQGLADSISRAIRAAKNIDTEYVVCSVPEAKSFIRTLEIPKMDEREIDGAIPFELEQDIPVPIDQVYLDWQILRELPDKLEVLVTASSKDYIDSLLETLHLAKLQPLVLEIAAQATARALIGPDSLNKNILIADIGARQTSFIVADHGTPIYTSSIPLAGKNFTESIARNLGLNATVAEKLKLKTDLASESDKQGVEVRKAILPLLDNIVDEIKNVMKFFQEHSSVQSKIDAVYLCGGSSRIPGVLEYVSAKINLGTRPQLEVILGQPWSNIAELSQEKNTISAGESLNFATAIGLALRGSKFEL